MFAHSNMHKYVSKLKLKSLLFTDVITRFRLNVTSEKKRLDLYGVTKDETTIRKEHIIWIYRWRRKEKNNFK